jgi:hypothetical protein
MSYAVQTLLALLSIAAGAALGGPAEAVSAAAVDVQTRLAEERLLIRYFELDHLDKPIDREEIAKLLSGLFNGTSHRARIVRPVVVLLPSKPGGLLEEADILVVAKQDWARAVFVRINYEDYGYDRKTMELLAKVEPHFHDRPKKFQTATVKVPAPAAVEAEPEPEDPYPGLPRAVYVERGGRLGEVGIETVSEGTPIFVRQARGGLVRMTMPARRGRAREAAPKKEEKVERPNNVYSAILPKSIGDLALATNSDSPIQQGDWAWWQMSIQAEREPGPGYYDLLGVKNQDEFWERVGFDKNLLNKRFAEFVKEYREVARISGISRQPRRVSVEGKVGDGKIWITFDNKVATGRANPVETPNGGFTFQATEQMAHLPNGWMAQGLFVGNDPGKDQKEGDRQDSAPDFIGPDKTSTGNDGRIHCGICWRCHDDGLKPFTGHFKKQYSGPARNAGPDYEKIRDFNEQYFGKLERSLKPSVDLHAAAVKEATGWTLAQYSKAIGNQWYKYEDAHVSMKRAARERGITPQLLQQAWRAYKPKGSVNGLVDIDTFGLDEKEQELVPIRQWLDNITELDKALVLFGKGKP